MISKIIQFRVRYGETDQMRYAYHGNYAQYFEMGRIEWLRDLGISYKDMENAGIMLPVVSLSIKFVNPAKYDDLLTLKTTLLERPTAKIKFQYEITNEIGELLTTAETALVFVNRKTQKPTRPPENLLKFVDDKLKNSQSN
jgi:acyl-CoA thioester hydrolase